MRDDLVPDASLRQFLLGQLSDEERQQIEIRFITDSLSRERILLVEQDLIEDYLEDSLTAAERERFVQQYAENPAQLPKLRIAESLKNRARKATATKAVPSTMSVWQRVVEQLRSRLVLVVPVAAILIIAIVSAAIWLNRRVERRNRHLAIVAEVIRLNAPSSLGEVPPQMSSLKLRPGAVRSGESQPELAAFGIVELHLLWRQPGQYPNYRAVVQRVGGDEPITVSDLHADSDGKTIRLRLPAQHLTRGTYRIELSGIAADGVTSPTEEYQFTVRG